VDFYGQRGFGVIAITDHICERSALLGKAAYLLKKTLTPATFNLYREILRSEAKRAWDQYGMIVLPGVEYSKNFLSNNRSAHVLAIFPDVDAMEFSWADPPIAELSRSTRKRGGIFIAAHPVSTRKREKQTYHLWDNRDLIKHLFDAWEVASGPYWFEEVAAAELPIIASSDLHYLAQIHAWKTVLRCAPEPREILRRIRAQEIEFVFYEAPPLKLASCL